MTTVVIDNNGNKLHSKVYLNKDKETIILLHGGPGVPDDLLPVVDLLKDTFQVITFHQRGTKLSPCINHDYSMNAYVNDIQSIKKHFKLTSFHLWGHSWGGLYAQIYAQKYPGNLLSLFLCSTASGTNIHWKQTEKEVMDFNKSSTSFLQWLKMGWYSSSGYMGNNKSYQKLFQQVIKNYNKKFQPINTSVFSFSLNNVKAKPINKTRPEIIKYPLLLKNSKPNYKISIVYGEFDIYKVSKKFVFDRYPSASVKNIKDSGHLPWLHNPFEFKKVVSHFYNLKRNHQL